METESQKTAGRWDARVHRPSVPSVARSSRRVEVGRGERAREIGLLGRFTEACDMRKRPFEQVAVVSI